MTREEAVEYLKALKKCELCEEVSSKICKNCENKSKGSSPKCYDAIDKAINVLMAIEDIKAEIQEHTQRYTLARESGCMGQVVWSDYLIKADDVIKLIDKHIGKEEGAE